MNELAESLLQYAARSQFLDDIVLTVLMLMLMLRAFCFVSQGGAIYSTSDGWNSTLAYNHLDGDPVQYGVIYHDGGSANWHDTRNVIENAHTSCIFTHGSWCVRYSPPYR